MNYLQIQRVRQVYGKIKKTYNFYILFMKLIHFLLFFSYHRIESRQMILLMERENHLYRISLWICVYINADNNYEIQAKFYLTVGI